MKTEIKIIDELDKNRQGVHLRQLSRLVHTGFPNARRFVNLLEKEATVLKRKDGNQLKVLLKPGFKTISYLHCVHIERFLGLPPSVRLCLGDFLSELAVKPLILLIFGSYAKTSYRQGSDVDVLLVYQKVEGRKEIENASRRIGRRYNIALSPVYVDYKDFEKNILNPEHEFSKEIRGQVILLVGLEYYYALLWRYLG